MIVKVILILFFLFLFPLLIGRNFINENERLLKSFFEEYAWGFMCMFALFALIAVPATFLRVTLSTVTVIWLIVCICFILVGIIRKKMPRIKANIKNIKLSKNGIASWCALALIAFQTIYVAFRMHTDADDAMYVGSAVASWTTNTINLIDPYTGDYLVEFYKDYTLSPFPIFWAMIAKLVSVHPTILMHTILPVFLIPLSYMVYYLIACKILKNHSEYIGYFMFFLCMFNIFGYYSPRLPATYLLFRIWQGKAVLCNIVLPLMIYIFILCMENKGIKNWLLELITVGAATMVSSMGVLLVPVLLFALAVSIAVVKKNIRVGLYAIICCLPCIIELFVYFKVLR